MGRNVVPRRAVLALVVAALVLPIGITLILGLAALLGAMGDAAGKAVLARVALAGGIVWGIDLVCLLLVQAVASLGEPEQEEESRGEMR
jgi:hypothetical protein